MTIQMPSRSVYQSFHLDTNRINSREALANMNQLEQWCENGVILLEMSQAAHAEAKAGGDIRRTRKALRHIFSMTMNLTKVERDKWEQIEDTLSPGGAQTAAQKNDVEIVFNAWKYKRVLVTADGGSKTQPGGILGNRARLEELGVRVMADNEAVARVGEAIRVRDENAQWVSKRTGDPLPPWVRAD